MNMPHVPGLSPLASYGSARDISSLSPIEVHCEPAKGYGRHVEDKREMLTQTEQSHDLGCLTYTVQRQGANGSLQK
jgi:hypothetical protein